MEEKYKDQLSELNEQISKYEKKINVLENNQKKNKYPDGGIIYIVRSNNIDDDSYLKLGYTNKANKRFNTYNTSLPDNIEILYTINVKSPQAI